RQGHLAELHRRVLELEQVDGERTVEDADPARLVRVGSDRIDGDEDALHRVGGSVGELDGERAGRASPATQASQHTGCDQKTNESRCFQRWSPFGPVKGRGRPRAADGKPDPPRHVAALAVVSDLAGFGRGEVGRCRVNVSWVAAGPSLPQAGLMYRPVQAAARDGTSARGVNRL